MGSRGEAPEKFAFLYLLWWSEKCIWASSYTNNFLTVAYGKVIMFCDSINIFWQFQRGFDLISHFVPSYRNTFSRELILTAFFAFRRIQFSQLGPYRRLLGFTFCSRCWTFHTEYTYDGLTLFWGAVCKFTDLQLDLTERKFGAWQAPKFFYF